MFRSVTIIKDRFYISEFSLPKSQTKLRKFRDFNFYKMVRSRLNVTWLVLIAIQLSVIYTINVDYAKEYRITYEQPFGKSALHDNIDMVNSSPEALDPIKPAASK